MRAMHWRAVAATTQAIADEALALIDVTYEVLPHVIDVEEAMAPDAPILHDDMFTAGVDPKPDKAIEHRQGRNLQEGRRRGRLQGSRRRSSRVATRRSRCTRPISSRTPASRPMRSDGQVQIHSSSQGHFMVRAYTAKLLGLDMSEHPGQSGRDRRRLRRQDTGLSGALGGRAVEEVRAGRSRCR